MENVIMRIEGKKLIIEIDLSVKGKPSKSGKSVVIASTRGNAQVPDREEHIGLNVYRPVQ